MKILHLSDTHSCHRRLRDLSEADVVVHSGDFTMTGSEAEAIDFLNWFCDLPYRQKIFICGNHDACLYGASIDGLDDNVHYLCNTSIEIEGVKFYGVPMFMEDCVTDCQKRNYAAIPMDTDILITHLENPGADDPWGQVDLTPEAKIGLTPLPKIKMTPVDIEPAGDFICIFGFRFGRRGIKPKKHEYKVKKHSPVSRIGNGNKKHQQCF